MGRSRLDFNVSHRTRIFLRLARDTDVQESPVYKGTSNYNAPQATLSRQRGRFQYYLAHTFSKTLRTRGAALRAVLDKTRPRLYGSCMSRALTTSTAGASRATRRGWLVLPFAALTLGPLPCAAAQAQGTQAAKPLVLIHWWTSPSEMAALDALSAAVKAEYPDFTEKRIPAPADRGAGLFAVLQRLSRAGNPPDIVTMSTGYNMKPFVDANLLARLDDLWISQRLERVIPPALQAVNSFGGHYYSAPIDVHRTNLVWYNKKLLDRHGIDPAGLTTQEAFFQAAERLRAAGVSAPIQSGAIWTMVPVFEGLMASQGLAAYQDWVNGRMRSAADPRLAQALAALKRYVAFVNRDYASIDWQVALRRVAAGESAFLWMGDWVNGDFRAAGLVYGQDYGVIVAPGTNGLYGVSIDAFVKPLGNADPESANRWLKVATSREGQDAFNAAKGSIPARKDPHLARYDAYQRWAIASLKQSKPYPIVSAALPAPYVRRLSAVLEAFLVDGDVRRAAAALASAAGDASFTQVWSLQ